MGTEQVKLDINHNHFGPWQFLLCYYIAGVSNKQLFDPIVYAVCVIASTGYMHKEVNTEDTEMLYLQMLLLWYLKDFNISPVVHCMFQKGHQDPVPA